MQGIDDVFVNRALGHSDKIGKAHGDGIRAARAEPAGAARAAE